ncbi:hypothetical protein GCM10028778_16630 [Barrientosiimonas marina]|uniref:Glycine betaine ABC transporter substrate-binding protein n=1 Tax=Lentibacillus kimchii TaxID=1542911 RepID=A0ABW2UXZ8_9BACI
MKKQSYITAMIAILLLMFLGACGSDDNSGNSTSDAADEGGMELGGKKLTLGVDSYVSNTSNTYVAKLLLEEIGYDVDINQTDVGVEYTGLNEGSNDAIVGGWLPTTHESYWEEYGDNLEKINTVTENVELSLTVPAYMEDINSIKDLADNTDDIGEKLDWEITGISPGAGEMKIMNEDVMPGYGLDDDWNLTESSGGAMSAALGDAINNEDPIVVTLWEPHWTYNEYDLKKLDDPKEKFGKPDDVFAIAGKDFEENHPAAYKFLSQFEISQKDTQDIMQAIKNDVSEEEAAKDFIAEHPDLKDKWLEGIETAG